jgi:hypothetical protein
MPSKQTNLKGKETEDAHPRIILKDPKPPKTQLDKARELLRQAQEKRKNEGQTEEDIESF